MTGIDIQYQMEAHHIGETYIVIYGTQQGSSGFLLGHFPIDNFPKHIRIVGRDH